MPLIDVRDTPECERQRDITRYTLHENEIVGQRLLAALRASLNPAPAPLVLPSPADVRRYAPGEPPVAAPVEDTVSRDFAALFGLDAQGGNLRLADGTEAPPLPAAPQKEHADDALGDPRQMMQLALYDGMLTLLRSLGAPLAPLPNSGLAARLAEKMAGDSEACVASVKNLLGLMTAELDRQHVPYARQVVAREYMDIRDSLLTQAAVMFEKQAVGETADARDLHALGQYEGLLDRLGMALEADAARRTPSDAPRAEPADHQPTGWVLHHDALSGRSFAVEKTGWKDRAGETKKASRDEYTAHLAERRRQGKEFER